ncbi:MAG: hypothetical protein F6K08_35085 [Okeania sp. SIO1H6]|nr:hypothetical protein [Okeania sp. SIO1H6]
MQGKILRRADFFSGASENENVCGFPVKRNGWKDLTRERQEYMMFMEASENENLSDISPGEIS